MPITGAKILAKLIKMYRAAYVTSAGIGASGGVHSALMKAIVGSKAFRPNPNAFTSKNVENMMKMILAGKQIK